MIAHHGVGSPADHAHVLEPALVRERAPHRGIEIVASLRPFNSFGRLGDRFPLCVRDSLVLVDLGLFGAGLCILVELVFLDLSRLLGLAKELLVLEPLTFLLARRRLFGGVELHPVLVILDVLPLLLVEL